MSEQKPKKDLRARLGKTISPTTPGAPPIAAPGAVPGIAPPAVAPPAIAPPAIAAPPGVVAPPPAVAAPAALFGGGIAPPPFAQPAAPAAAPPRQSVPSDPFAAASAASMGPQEVRLVIDEKPVDDAEVGRAQRGRIFAVAAVCALVGAALGAGGGSMNSRRGLYNITVRDGQAIAAAVSEASQTMERAQQQINLCVEGAAGAAGQPSRVNYEAVQALQGLENPLPAGTFSRRNYGAFQASTVDDLFAYYNNIQQLWTMFQHLGARTLPESRRAELDRTATATADAASQQYVAVLVRAPEEEGGLIVGQLGFATEAPPENNQPRVNVSATRGGASRTMAIFGPGVEITSSPTHVLVIDGAGSRGVLASQTGAFGDYVNEIREIRTLVDQTIEIQGRLTTSLGEIASLPEVFAL